MTTLTQPSDVQSLIADAHEKAKLLPPNTIKVWPGGATFTNIQAAINSITNASSQVQYQVAIGAGTYTGHVDLKDYIVMSGAGQDQTFLTMQGDLVIGGTLSATGQGCGAGMMTVTCTGGPSGTYVCALYVPLSCSFNGSGLTLTGTDSGNAGNIVSGLSNQGGAGQVNLTIGSSNISALTANGTSGTVAVQVMGAGSTLNIELSTVVGGGSGGVGILMAGTATATVEDCNVTGQNWSLQNFDNQSLITASGCTLTGPPTAGVNVNP